jgi:hypothetical protein
MEKSDIVGLVSHAWNQSFAWVDSNQKGVAKPSELNFTLGIARSLTDKIVLFRAREAAQMEENATEMLRQREKTVEEVIAQEKRLTVGLHSAAGNFCLGPDCLKNIQDKIRKEEERKYQSAIRLKEEHDKILAEVEAIKLLNKTSDQWSVSQLQTMVK